MTTLLAYMSANIFVYLCMWICLESVCVRMNISMMNIRAIREHIYCNMLCVFDVLRVNYTLVLDPLRHGAQLGAIGLIGLRPTLILIEYIYMFMYIYIYIYLIDDSVSTESVVLCDWLFLDDAIIGLSFSLMIT